jgi:hypothetical protein
MELFTKIIRENTILYHGSEKQTFQLPKLFEWFALDIRVAHLYGNYMSQYRTSKSLNLINIQSGIFKIHFMDQLNEKYGFNTTGTTVNKDKTDVLMTIGMPNYESVVRVYGTPTCTYTSQDIEKHVHDNVPFFYGDRNSFDKKDLKMIKDMKEIYENYGFDGYISTTNIPSRYTCGWFHPEIGLFRPQTVFTQNGGHEKTYDASKYITKRQKD